MPLDKKDVLQKLMKYCAFQERCHQEVRQKILSYSIYGDELEEIIYELINSNYLNEERFAITFAGGKFRLKRWGKNRIRFELQQRNISQYCIDKAVNEIDAEDYQSCLEKLVDERLRMHSHIDLILAKDKVLKFCTAKGFEIDFVLKELRKY